MNTHPICLRRVAWILLLACGVFYASCCHTAFAGPARFWISTSGTSTAGPDATPPSLNLPIGTTQTIYVWATPMTDSGDFKNLHNLSLNLVADPSSAAVYDILDTFQIDETTTDRFQPVFVRDSDSAFSFISSSHNEAAVLGGSLDSVIGLQAGLALTETYTGIGLDQPGDNANPSVKAWRIASIELRGVLDSGVANLHLQIGSLGMTHANEFAVDTSVIFGAPTDPLYNAKDHREMTFPNHLSSLIDTADLTITGAANLHPGDFDGDGDVDGADFVVWQDNFPTTSGATLATGDADGDGDVDGADFVVWQTNFPFFASAATSPVPEPGSFALALLALGVCLAHRRFLSSFQSELI